MQSSGRTFVQTFAAADTLHAVRCLGRIDIHLASLGASFAVDTLALIASHPVKRYFIEKTVDRAKRTDIFTEGSSDNKTCNYEDQKQYQLPVKKRSQDRSHLLVSSREHDACKRPFRADIFAKEGRQVKCHRQNDHQYKQHRILQIAEKLIDSEPVFLIKRYLVDQVLQKSERTKEAANCPAQYGSEEDQKTHDIVWELKLDPA